MLKGEKIFLKRVCALPSDLASAYLEDLEATAKERLAFFERIAKNRPDHSAKLANKLD